MTTRSAAVLSAALLVVLGCENKTPQPPLAPPKQAPGPTSAPSPHAQTPATTPPAASAPAVAPPAVPAAAGNDANVVAMGVSVTLPAGWQRNPPANQMRLAEAVVPDSGGDANKSCLVVFSTAGGSVDDNVARWSGQVRDAAGQPVAPKSEKRTINGLNVTVVSMQGTFAGMGDTAPKPDWMLKGAIIESAQGLLFIKMTGPAASMDAAAKGFEALVESIKKS